MPKIWRSDYMLADNKEHVKLNDFLKMKFEDNGIYELLNGIICMSPRPSTFHQRILTRLSIEIGKYLENGTCEGVNETQMIIGEHLLVPDYFVYCDEQNMGEQQYTGTATLVIEVLSKSTAFRDLSTKLNIYKEHGIKEYWVVSQHLKTVVIYDFTKGKNDVKIDEYSQEMIATSNVFEGLKVDLHKIFKQ